MLQVTFGEKRNISEVRSLDFGVCSELFALGHIFFVFFEIFAWDEELILPRQRWIFSADKRQVWIRKTPWASRAPGPVRRASPWSRNPKAT